MLAIIRNSVISADTLLNNLLEFEKELKLTLTKTDIHYLIEESLSDLFVPDNIEIKTNINDEIPINLDIVKMKRVFLNLFLNSVQSMPGGGKITITTKTNKDAVEISIKDTGFGISEENLKKVFLPFYSTRKKGIGLGLVNTNKIVESHKGTIKIESKEKKGTTVKITLSLAK